MESAAAHPEEPQEQTFPKINFNRQPYFGVTPY